VPCQEGGVPGLLENQENRNAQNGPEVLHPAPAGGPLPAEPSPFVEMLNQTAIGSGRDIDDAFIESGSKYIQEKHSKWELSKTEAHNDWFLIGALKAFFIFMSKGDDLVIHAEKDRTPLRNPVEATRAITYLADLNKQGVEIDISDYAQSGLDQAGLSEDADTLPGRDPLAFARGVEFAQSADAKSRQAALGEFERALSATIALAPDLDAQKQIVAAAVHNVALEAGIISSDGEVKDEKALEYLTEQMSSLWVKSSPVAGGTSYAALRFAEQIAEGFDPDADNFSDIVEAVNQQALNLAAATVTNSSDAGKVLEVRAQFKDQIWGALLGNETFTSKMKTSLSAIYKEVEELHDLSKTTDMIAKSVTGRISPMAQQDSRLRSLDEEFGLHLELLNDQMPSAMFSILREFQGAFNEQSGSAEMSLEDLMGALDVVMPAEVPSSGDALIAFLRDQKPELDGDDFLTCIKDHYDSETGKVDIFKVFKDPRLLARSAINAERQSIAPGLQIKTENQAMKDLFKRWVGYASTDGIMRQYQEINTYFSESDSHIHATVEAYGKEGKEAKLEVLKAHEQKLSNLVGDLAGSKAGAAFESLGFQDISAIDDSPLYGKYNLPMEKYYAMLEQALSLGHDGGTGSPTAMAELLDFLPLTVVAYLLITQGRVSYEVYLKQKSENPELQELHLKVAGQLEGLTSQDVDGGKSVSFSMQGRVITLAHWANEAGLQAFKEGIQEAQTVSMETFSRNAPLGSYHSAVGATYAEGVVGENVCDWTHVDPAGFSMVVDGVGHNDSALVAREHPIYAGLASDHAQFVRETQVESQEQYAEALDAQVLSYSQEFRRKKNAYEDDAIQGGEVVSSIVRPIIENVQADQPGLTEEKFLALTELISRQKFEETLRDPDFPVLAANCMQAILDKDFDAFNRYAALYKDLDRSDPSWSLFHNIKYKNLPKGSSGPAFGMAQFFKAEDQDHLYLNRMADVCFMVIQPKGQERSVDRKNITSDQVAWVEESKDQLGLGDQSGEGAKKGTVMAVRPGTIVMSFSDGIGEFLTQEEILEVIKEGHSLERFEEKIMVEDRRDDTRMRASHSKAGCKTYDPESAHFHDDVSYSWMVLK